MIGVLSHQVPEVWGEVGKHVRAALEHGNGEYLEIDIFDALVGQKMQLWRDGDTIAVTTIIRYPRKTTCLIVLSGGSIENVRRSLPLLEQWAKAQGCHAMDVAGRKGWLRELKNNSQNQVRLWKEL